MQKIQTMSNKWNVSGIQVDLIQDVRNYIFCPLVEQLGMDADKIFELCENYFKLNEHRFHWINEMEKKRLISQDQVRYEKFSQEMKQVFSTVVKEVRQFYFVERKMYIQIIKCLASQNQPHSKSREILKNFFNQKLVKVMPDLINFLSRNLKWEQDFQILILEERKEIIMSHIQDEQIDILTTILIISQSKEIAELDQFLDYLVLTGFRGENSVENLKQLQFNQSEKQDIIKNLGQMCALSIIFKSNYQIKHKIQAENLSQASLFVYLPILVKNKQVALFQDQIKDKPLLEELKSILNSEFIVQNLTKSIFMELLQKWLDVIFEYASPKQGEYIKNENLLEEIRDYGLKILKDHENIKRFWIEGNQSVKMFQVYFLKPEQNFDQLLKILEILCGSNKQSYTKQVFKFLAEKNLLQELFAQIAVKLVKLQHQQLELDEIDSLSSACIILAKIIKQNPDLFDNLNAEYLLVANKNQSRNFATLSAQSPFQQRSAPRQSYLSANLHFEDGALPVLALITKVLHEYFNVHIDKSQRCIINMIDALGQIFKYHPLEIVNELNKQVIPSSTTGPIILVYFEQIFKEFSNRPFNYDLTSAMLKFITQIFKVKYPQECLDDDHRIRFECSFLTQCIQHFYSPLVENYFSLQFTDPKSMHKMTFLLLKLSQELFLKFDQVSDSGQKFLISMPLPKFDIMLESIKNGINQDQVYLICIYNLQLQERSSEQNFYVNRFVPEIQGPQKIVKWLQKMVQMSIKLLNLLLQLGLTDQNQEAEKVSIKTYYLRQLLPVKQINSYVFNSTQLQTKEGKLIDLPSIIAYYVNPSVELSYSFIIKEALRFLTLSMKVMKQDLYLSLRQIFGQNLHFQIMQNFQFQRDDELIPSYFDFWILAVEKQPRLVEELWTAQISDFLVQILEKNNFDVAIKIGVLTGLMAEKRCCLGTLEFRKHNLIQKLYQVFQGQLQKNPQVFPLNGHQLYDQVVQQGLDTEKIKIKEYLLIMNTKISLSYFLKLLHFEFARVPTSDIIRDCIQKLYQDARFQQMGTKTLKDKEEECLKLVYSLNDNTFKNKDYRNLQKQGVIHSYASGLLKMPETLQILQTVDGSIFINQIDSCKSLADSLKQQKPYTFINCLFDQDFSNSLVGTRFAVDVDELKYILRQEFYQDIAVIEQIVYVFKEYNLLLSDIYSDSVILKSKSEFIFSIGQTQMRELQQKVNSSQLITASMLPLITSQQEYSDDQLKQIKNLLFKQAVQQVQMLQQALSRLNNQQNQVIMLSYDQVMQNLIVQLGIVRHLSSEQIKEDFMQNTLQNLLYCLPDISVSIDPASQQQYSSVVLLVFSIFANVGSKQKDTTVLKTLSRIMQNMRTGFCFNEGLQIFIVACDVLEQSRMHDLMQKQDSSVLRMILNRLNDSKATPQEVQQILIFLRTYAITQEGSQHLYQMKLLEQMHQTECLRKVNIQEPYLLSGQSQVRNQSHIQWLQIMLLVRQMNANLIRSPRTENKGYFKQVCHFVSSLESRFIQVLSVCINKAAVISLAIYEEIELMTSLLSQLFEHADYWSDIDNTTFTNLKDYMLFAVPQITQILSISILPNSITEQHLASITNKDRSLLQIKVEMSLIKIMLCCASSLKSLFQCQKETNNPLVSNWQNNRMDDSSSLYNSYLRDLKEFPLSYAFENFVKCMDQLRDLLIQYQSDDGILASQVKQTADLFLHNQWIQNEYQGGIAIQLVEENIDQMQEFIEITLGMALFIITTLLEFTRNQLGQIYSYNYSNSRQMFDNKQSGQYLEERILTSMANYVLKFVDRVKSVVDYNGKKKGIWGEKPENYLDTFWTFAREVIENPSNTQFY